MMTNWKFCCLSILFVTITTAPALDVQQCLTCWHKLCEDGTYNSPQNLCSCPCINATLYSASDSCNSKIGSYNNAPNNLCCPVAEQFIKTVIKPAIEPVAFTNISACSTLYNPPPNQFVEDDYEELLLDNQYVFYDVQFTCSGCIKNITIYHKFSNNMNRILTVQLWKVHHNISDNSSLLLLSENQSITFTTTSTSWFDYYQTVGEVELCFEPGDIFGITVPSSFNGIDIFAEKSTPNSQFYARERPSCNSLRNVYYLNSIAKRPLIAIGVSENVQVTSSTVHLVTPSSFTSIVNPSSLSESSFLSSRTSETTSTSEMTTTTLPPAISSTTQLSSTSAPSVIISIPSVPTSTDSSTNILIYSAAAITGFIIFIFILLILLVFILLICVIISRGSGKKEVQDSVELKATNSFHRVNGSQEYTTPSICTSTEQVSHSSTTPSLIPSHTRNEVVDSALIHDYDLPHELNLVPFRQSGENIGTLDSEKQYTTMINSVRPNTPSTISNASERSHYSQPRPINRYQSPATNQRYYDSPRCVHSPAISSNSEYDDPGVLDRTPQVNHRLMTYNTKEMHDSGNSFGRVMHDKTNSHAYDTIDNPPGPIMHGQMGSHAYHTLENPSGVIMHGQMGSHTYHTLENPSGVIMHGQMGSHAYHTLENPTNPSGQRFNNNSHLYHKLENPNEQTGQAEKMYFELDPNSQHVQTTWTNANHYYHELENPGYHVPTYNERMSMIGILPPNPSEQNFFVNQPQYEEPAADTEHIYEQLSKFKCREIPFGDILFSSQLGEGQFGTVKSGFWNTRGGKKAVAIKELKSSANESERAKFLREGARMMQFFHPNVVKLYGVVTIRDPPLLIIELMREGDLKTYLKSCRPPTPRDNNKQTRPVPAPTLLLKFSRDIANGMKHLATKKFVHRDLAARNVMLNENLICKIGDFGMTRTAAYTYDLSKPEQIPLRWTAPEAINGRQYSEKSDVYSYGMVMFEIWSLGRKPFPTLNQNQEIIDFIVQKRLIPPPPGCPRNIYDLMVKCWNPSQGDRLSFDSICHYYSDTSEESLLTWEKDDIDKSPRASEIGAPIREGYRLYTELQHEYRDDTNFI